MLFILPHNVPFVKGFGAFDTGKHPQKRIPGPKIHRKTEKTENFLYFSIDISAKI